MPFPGTIVLSAAYLGLNHMHFDRGCGLIWKHVDPKEKANISVGASGLALGSVNGLANDSVIICGGICPFRDDGRKWSMSHIYSTRYRVRYIAAVGAERLDVTSCKYIFRDFINHYLPNPYTLLYSTRLTNQELVRN